MHWATWTLLTVQLIVQLERLNLFCLMRCIVTSWSLRECMYVCVCVCVCVVCVRACVRACVRLAYPYINSFRTIPVYTHKHTQTSTPKPFGDSEPMGLKVHIAGTAYTHEMFYCTLDEHGSCYSHATCITRLRPPCCEAKGRSLSRKTKTNQGP